MSLKKLYLPSLFFILCFSLIAAPINIPLGGNAYLTENRQGAKISDEGVTEWKDASSVISVWFKLSKAGPINLSMRAKALANNVGVQVTVEGKTYPVELKSKNWSIVPIADNINISNPGYVRVDIQGTNKDGEVFAELSDLVIDGSATAEPMNFVRDFSYYWGRRGPSVHMGYTLPDDDVEYFYNEVTVPEGEDVIGSYFMANGFGEGYFGIQVNSPTERRVLFSVWSPFKTDNPKEIPAEEQIKKMRQGKDVHIGEFGNEGSGGQSYLRYMWKAGNTYRFLTHIRPDGKGNTQYTGYFYAPETGEWRLISSFLRPKTDTWYKRPHSFLENFIPAQGYMARKVLFGNQWAVTTKGKWIELTEGTFTHDATANAKVRMDFTGGHDATSNRFFLQNCGFFDESTKMRTKFTRSKENKKPNINFKKLQSLKE